MHTQGTPDAMLVSFGVVDVPEAIECFADVVRRMDIALTKYGFVVVVAP